MPTVTTTITVTALPHAKKRSIQKISDTDFRISTTIAPENNKATLDIIEQLADYFSIAKSRIACVRGRTNRKKVFVIT